MTDEIRINRVDLALLEVRDGDVIIVKIPEKHSSDEILERVRQAFKKAMVPCANSVIVVPDTINLQVLARRVHDAVYNSALDDAVLAVAHGSKDALPTAAIDNLRKQS